jgi:hypothetical protein
MHRARTWYSLGIHRYIPGASLWHRLSYMEGGVMLGWSPGHPWGIPEASLGHPWGIPGASLGHLWGISGAFLGHPWGISGASLGHPWGISGASTGHAHGIHRASTGHLQGMHAHAPLIAPLHPSCATPTLLLYLPCDPQTPSCGPSVCPLCGPASAPPAPLVCLPCAHALPLMPQFIALRYVRALHAMS